MNSAVRREYVTGLQGQMHLRIAHPEGGNHPPLVCIHMSPMTGRTFERFLGAIGTDSMGIAFDAPGFSTSDPPPAPPEIGDCAQDILSGVDALGVPGPFDLMGYHTGSIFSVALALHAPARVRQGRRPLAHHGRRARRRLEPDARRGRGSAAGHRTAAGVRPLTGLATVFRGIDRPVSGRSGSICAAESGPATTIVS